MSAVTLILAPENIKSILAQLETGTTLLLPLAKPDNFNPTMMVMCYHYRSCGTALLIKLTNDERRRIRRLLLSRYT
jgi:hypothetical protein